MFDAYHPLVWVALFGGVLSLLLLDILVMHRRAHVIQMREAAMWTAGWVTIACLFGVLVYFWLGATAALEYTTGYLIELSLSVDNLFVFALIFTALGVPRIYQHRVLFWGIIGALVMRFIFIIAGSALLETFHYTIYFFGALLIYAAIRMVREGMDDAKPADGKVLYWMSRFFPMTPKFHGSSFFTVENGRRVGTGLFGALILVEITDLMFAIDSVPAILAITRDPFLVFSSNAFAVLGLRSLYFVLSGVLEKFHYLKYGLAIILGYVGIKLMLSDVYPLPVWSSLLVMLIAVGGSMIFSIIWPLEESEESTASSDTAHDAAETT